MYKYSRVIISVIALLLAAAASSSKARRAPFRIRYVADVFSFYGI